MLILMFHSVLQVGLVESLFCGFTDVVAFLRMSLLVL